MEALLALALLGGIFALGYWIGSMRTKIKMSPPTFDWKKFEKMKKALDESFQKMQNNVDKLDKSSL